MSDLPELPEPLFYDHDDEYELWDEYQMRAYGRACIAAAGARWQPIETAPKDGTTILVCGGAAVYYGSAVPLVGVSMAAWDKTNEYWRGEQLPAHDEWVLLNPVSWMSMPAPQEAEGMPPSQAG